MKDNRRASSLDTRQQCRDKLSNHFGSRENFYHPILEVLANALDEVEHYRDEGHIIFTLGQDNQTVTIQDNGRGVLLLEHIEEEGKDNYQLLFERLYAGTKYDEITGEKSGNSYTGCNGVGTCVINHTSVFFKVESYHDGYREFVEYKDGGYLVNKGKEKYSGPLTGSIFSFKLDGDVYTSTTFNPNVVKDLLEHCVAVSNKTTIEFVAEALERKFVLHYDAPVEYFKLVEGENLTSAIAISKGQYDSPYDIMEVETVIATSMEPNHKTYLNRTHLRMGGTIVDRVIETTRKVMTDYCITNNLMEKGVKSFSTKDIAESFSFICKVVCQTAEYENQTKLSTQSKIYNDAIKQNVEATLLAFEKEQPKDFKDMVDHLLTISKANRNTNTIRENLNKKLKKKIKAPSDRPDGLTDCIVHDDTSELFIGEGRSACGALAKARDGKTQAIIPVRGKILNCLKANLSSIQNNPTILNLMRAIGTGILDEFDIELFRYSKIILAMDADSDGFQIRQLILCMLWRLAKPLVLNGCVYFAETPLYKIVKANGEVVYIYAESEKEKVLNTIEGKYTISRIKGLGEADPKLLYDTTMNPETRNITRVIVEDEKAFEANLIAWMGKDTTERKERILRDIDKYVDVV